MSIRFDAPFRPAIASVASKLRADERALFDLLCRAGQLGYRLPDRRINLAAAAGPKDPRRRLRAELPAGAQSLSDDWQRTSDGLTRRLLKRLTVRPLPDEDRALRVLLAYATIALAPDNRVPHQPLFRAAWDCAVKLFARLFSSRVRTIAPPDCVTRRLAALQRETAAGLRVGRTASGERPGRAGRNLAVDPALAKLVGEALEREFVPGYMARHLFYARAGDHIWPHPDDPNFDVTALICVSHKAAAGTRRKSAFLAYGRDGTQRRYELVPGEILAVEPGIIHAREPVRRGEKVALLSIGLRAAQRSR